MDPDLMSSPGPRPQSQQANPRRTQRLVLSPKGFLETPFCNRLSFSSHGVNARHSFPIRTVPPYGPIDDPALVFRFPQNKRHVFLLHPSFFELPRELLKSGHAFSDNHDARGIFV
jgi:hypothetical protein